MSELGLTSDQCFYVGEEEHFVPDNCEESLTQQKPVHDLMMEELYLSPAQCFYLDEDLMCLAAHSAGKAFMKRLIAAYPEEVRRKMRLEKSERMYKFGGGEKRKSLGKILLPLKMTDVHNREYNIGITTEIVHTDFPMLFGGNAIDKSGPVIDFGEKTMSLRKVPGMEGVKFPIFKEASGHYSFKIAPVSGKYYQDETTILYTEAKSMSITQLNCLLEVVGKVDLIGEDISRHDIETFLSSEENRKGEPKELSRKEVEKIHHYFGHLRPSKVLDLIRDSGRLTDSVQKHPWNLVKSVCSTKIMCQDQKYLFPEQRISTSLSLLI